MTPQLRQWHVLKPKVIITAIFKFVIGLRLALVRPFFSDKSILHCKIKTIIENRKHIDFKIMS